MDLQDGLSSLDVRVSDRDLTVETAGTQERRVEDVGTVGGGDHDDAEVRGKSVHLDQQLVEGLLTLIVAAAETRASLTSYSVDFIYEYYTGRVLLSLVEQITYT